MKKNKIKFIAQRILGFDNYLMLFSIYKTGKAIQGKYERAFHHFITLIPEHEGVILDIGANIGITAVPLARARPKSTVYAFEPIHENFRTLQKVARFYRVKNINLNQTALGNSTGMLKMIMPIVSNAKLQGLSKVCEDDSIEPGVYYDVPVKRLDDLFANASNVSAIKIDVENFEYEVLRGAECILRKNKPIIYCELWNNEKREKVFSLMKDLGYQVFSFSEEKKRLMEVDSIYVGFSNNFLFM